MDDAPGELITRTIPSSGERIPAVGLGTNAFSGSGYSEARSILAALVAGGGSVVDTAASYGESEAVIGRAVAELGLRERLFLSTKFNAEGKGWGTPGELTGRASFERSLQRLGTTYIDLLEVHRAPGAIDLMADMEAYRREGRIRYLGVTGFRVARHAEIVALLRRYPLDFVQINYSIAEREAAREILPLAAQRGVAVMVNMPFGGRKAGLLGRLARVPLPDFAAATGATSWSQFMLKYVLSHPAVTCVVPGASRAAHFADNQAAARGAVPDADLRRRMEQWWDAHL